MAAYATITLELSRAGIHVICDDIEEEVFCPRGGNLQPLVDLINKADELCSPDTKFYLTEKAKKMLKEGWFDELLDEEGGRV